MLISIRFETCLQMTQAEKAWVASYVRKQLGPATLSMTSRRPDGLLQLHFGIESDCCAEDSEPQTVIDTPSGRSRDNHRLADPRAVSRYPASLW